MHLKKRLTAVGCGLLLVVALMPSAPADFHDIELPDDIEDDLHSIEALLDPVEEVTSPIPDDPVQALIDETATLSAELGFAQDVSLRILAADLPPEIAGRLANVVTDMLACYQTTSAHWEELDPDEERLFEIFTDGGGLDPADFEDIQACAEALYVTSVELELTLAALTPPHSCQINANAEIDIWPVLFFEGRCKNSDYPNDYLLIVDTGGHDTYVNNVGSNMVDLNWAPAGSQVPGLRGFGPAQGCQRAIPGLLAADCVPAVAVLLDMHAEDEFGIKQSPTELDQQCTEDDIVRRLVTVGQGFLGVGILISSDDENDKYTGKTGSVGSGHIFGVGLLLDRGGNDQFRAIRNSIGFALVGGVGILHSQGGNDDYGFYMPAVRSDSEFAGLDVIEDADQIPPVLPALDENEELVDPPPGNGGALDDTDSCDNRLRFLMGAGSVGSGPTVGIVKSESGQDAFQGGFSDDFRAPQSGDDTQQRGGSIGFGGLGGVGVLMNLAGSDSYEIIDQTGSQGTPERGDDTVILPGEESTGLAGTFIDLE